MKYFLLFLFFLSNFFLVQNFPFHSAEENKSATFEDVSNSFLSEDIFYTGDGLKNEIQSRVSFSANELPVRHLKETAGNKQVSKNDLLFSFTPTSSREKPASAQAIYIRFHHLLI